LSENEVIFEARNLKKYFTVKLGFLTALRGRAIFVHAVDDVSFKIGKGEVFGLVGESGCGKTTTGRVAIRLLDPTDGKIFFEGKEITSFSHEEMRKLRRLMQIIFQDPYESLNPRMSVYDIVSEPVHVQELESDEDKITAMVKNSLLQMGLAPPEEFLYRFPHEISGGQRQRVAIARALVTSPEFLVADEPVSMLDASIRVEVSKLMLDLVKNQGISMLYITHDIALARYMCDKIAVMYLGEIVEQSPTETLLMEPLHPYTNALMLAVPVPDPTARRLKVVVKGEVASPIAPPPGCRFHPRCPKAQDICRVQKPEFREIEPGRFVACHFPEGK
jgi:oligopeptide/dipeptide ABC transporter ATP-binding protein